MSNNKKVEINGILYESITDAAKKLGLTRHVLYYRVRTYGKHIPIERDLGKRPIIVDGEKYETINHAMRVSKIKSRKAIYERLSVVNDDGESLSSDDLRNRDKVIVNGVEYIGTSEASKALKVSLCVIYRAIKVQGSRTIKIDPTVTRRPGRSMEVIVNGVLYPSLSAAAFSTGKSAVTIKRIMKKQGSANVEHNGHMSASPVVMNGVKYSSMAEAMRNTGKNMYQIQNLIKQGVATKLSKGMSAP